MWLSDHLPSPPTCPASPSHESLSRDGAENPLCRRCSVSARKAHRWYSDAAGSAGFSMLVLPLGVLLGARLLVTWHRCARPSRIALSVWCAEVPCAVLQCYESAVWRLACTVEDGEVWVQIPVIHEASHISPWAGVPLSLAYLAGLLQAKCRERSKRVPLALFLSCQRLRRAGGSPRESTAPGTLQLSVALHQTTADGEAGRISGADRGVAGHRWAGESG